MILAGSAISSQKKPSEPSDRFDTIATNTEAVFGFDSPEQMKAWGDGLIPAYLGFKGRIAHRSCLHRIGRTHAVRFDADPETVCVCGRRMDEHRRRR